MSCSAMQVLEIPVLLERLGLDTVEVVSSGCIRDVSVRCVATSFVRRTEFTHKHLHGVFVHVFRDMCKCAAIDAECNAAKY